MKKEIYTDHALTSKARFIYLLCVHMGRVLTVDELVGFLPEGRTAITNGMSELKQAGYIKAMRYQTKHGRFGTQLLFGEDSLNFIPPTIEEPTVGEPLVTISSTAIDNSLAIASSVNTLEVLRTSNVPHGLRPMRSLPEVGEDISEEVEMAWPFEEQKSEPKRGQIDDTAPGSIGNVEDKKKLRQLKYTKFEAVPKSAERSDRPEEDWKTADLVAEFYDLLRIKAPGVPGQVNGARLATYINKMVRDGGSHLGVLKAIRMFFNDPRLIREAGFGQSLMVRFFKFYPTVHAKVNAVAVEEDQYLTESLLRKQNEMLKALGGE
jgi:hypothetical protein